jgi:hypothetical protein
MDALCNENIPKYSDNLQKEEYSELLSYGGTLDRWTFLKEKFGKLQLATETITSLDLMNFKYLNSL